MKAIKKTCLAILIAMVASIVFGAAPQPASPAAASSQKLVPLSAARRLISRVIASPKAMTVVMSRLSADDQKKFLAEVNQAIASRPGSPEVIAATFLNVNSAALKGAQPGNLSDLVAEVFATVPPEALTLINERFADDLFNRAADPRVTYTDEQFEKIAMTVMQKISQRTATADNSAVRDVFAALMLVRASNGSPADLAEKLTSHLPADMQAAARQEWIPGAMAKGQSQNYEAMLSSGGAEAAPNIEQALAIAGPQMLEALLEDLTGGSTQPSAASHQKTPVIDAVFSELHNMLPVGSGYVGDGMHPSGYQWQTTK